MCSCFLIKAHICPGFNTSAAINPLCYSPPLSCGHMEGWVDGERKTQRHSSLSCWGYTQYIRRRKDMGARSVRLSKILSNLAHIQGWAAVLYCAAQRLVTLLCLLPIHLVAQNSWQAPSGKDAHLLSKVGYPVIHPSTQRIPSVKGRNPWSFSTCSVFLQLYRRRTVWSGPRDCALCSQPACRIHEALSFTQMGCLCDPPEWQRREMSTHQSFLLSPWDWVIK